MVILLFFIGYILRCIKNKNKINFDKETQFTSLKVQWNLLKDQLNELKIFTNDNTKNQYNNKEFFMDGLKIFFNDYSLELEIKTKIDNKTINTLSFCLGNITGFERSSQTNNVPLGFSSSKKTQSIIDSTTNHFQKKILKNNIEIHLKKYIESFYIYLNLEKMETNYNKILMMKFLLIA